MPSPLDCSAISPPPRTPGLSNTSPPSFRRRGRKSLDKIVWDPSSTMETVPELEPSSGDCETAVPILDAHLGLNSSMVVLPEADDEPAVPAREPSPVPLTSMQTADGPDQPSRPSVPNEEPAPAEDITPLSPLTSEVEVHTLSDVTAETSAEAREETADSPVTVTRVETAASPAPLARVEVATSPVAFAAPALETERQETSAQTEAVSLTTTATQTTLHLGREDVVLLLPPGGGRLVAE